MTRITTFLKHNAIAMCALFISLGGVSAAAAISIPRNSVGARQLRNGAVTARKIHSGAITPGKLARGAFGGRILYFAEIENNGVVAVSDPKGVKTMDWTVSSAGGIVVFPRRIPKDCFPLATAGAGAATSGGAPSVGAGSDGPTAVQVSVNAPDPITLAIVCGR